MNPLFVNNTTMDRATCRAFLALTWRKNAGVNRVMLLLLGLLAFAYGMVQLLWGTPESVVFMVSIFGVAAVSFFLVFFGYLLRVAPYYKAQQALWGEDTFTKEVRFFKDRFEQTTKFGTLRFAYEDITRVTSGRRCVLLWMGQDTLLMEKGGFAEGTLEQFNAFIQGKIKARKNRNK